MLLFRNQQFMIVRYSNKSCLTKNLTLNVLISCISLQYFCQSHVLGLAFSFKVLQSPPGNFITALKFTSHARHIRLRVCELLSTDAGSLWNRCSRLTKTHRDLTILPTNTHTNKKAHTIFSQMHLQRQTRRYTYLPRNSPRYLRHWQIW